MKRLKSLIVLATFLLPIGLLAQDNYSETETPRNSNSAINSAQKLQLENESEKVDNRFDKILRKSKRWNKQLARSVARSLRDLKSYESQTVLWAESITNEYPDLEMNNAAFDEKVVFDLELQQYLLDLQAYSKLLNSKWRSTQSPSVGASISQSRNTVKELIHRRNDILSSENAISQEDVQNLNRRIEMTCDRIIHLYKVTSKENLEGSQIFQVLSLANEVMPIYKDYISKALIEMGRSEADRDVFNKQMASMVLGMSDEYLGSIEIAKKSAKESLEFFENNKIEIEPENIYKFKAQLNYSLNTLIASK